MASCLLIDLPPPCGNNVFVYHGAQEHRYVDAIVDSVCIRASCTKNPLLVMRREKNATMMILLDDVRLDNDRTLVTGTDR